MLDKELTRQVVEPAQPGSVHWIEYRNDGSELGSFDTAIVQPSFQTLFEKRSRDEKGSHKTWKSFEHYKCWADPGSGGLGSASVTRNALYSNNRNALLAKSPGGYWLYNGGSFGAPGVMNDGLSPYYNPAVESGFVPAPSGLDGLIASSLQSMLPLIRPALSGINSVIELKDFKSVKGTIRGIRSLPKMFLRKGRAFKDISDILRVAADVYLQKSFNIAPLISDIRGIARACHQTESRLVGLVSRQGKLLTRHYSRVVEEAGTTAEKSGYYAFGPHRLAGAEGDSTCAGAAFYTRHVTSDASTFHAQVQYNYYYDAFQLEHAQVLALLDSFGVNLNPAIIWNAIPWSFVIDWLVDVGQWLGNQRIGNMDPRINIMQYLWSIKRKRRIIVQGHTACQMNYTYSPEVLLGSITLPVVTETSYRRVSGLPTASSLTTSGLSSTEFSLGAALGITRRPHRL